MTVFNEKSHAFIAAKYYLYLTEEFGERGKKAFIHATQYYAGQRGRRMAQRAIRDGKDLTYEVYCQYGERVSSEEIKALGQANAREVVKTKPDYISNVTMCPWRRQFVEMGAGEAGLEYCRHLDNSICRGFNPYITYDVDLTHLETEGYCTHLIRDVDAEAIDMQKRPGNVVSFEYHCAHSYWAFHEVVCAIFGSAGERLAGKVLEDFSREYGEAAAETLYKYRFTNFNVTF